MTNLALPRLVVSSLKDRLRVMPAVVVTGARQAGKSTLAQELTPGHRRFVTLDDLDALDTARRDPDVLLGGSEPVTIDEVQREPDLLHAVKAAIDQERRAGQISPHRVGQPASHAAGLGIPGRSGKLLGPLADDPA